MGLVIAIFSGILGALQNIGYSEAQHTAINLGADDTVANLVSWMLVFVGGFLVQGGYTLYLLIRNKSYKTYSIRPYWKPWIKIVITSLFWFAALAFYGQGAAKMGELGTSVGWTMFLSLSLVISNTYAYFFGEWKGVALPLRILMLGNAVLVCSWIVLGYANSLIEY